MDPLDFDAFESVDLAADPFFGPVAIVLILVALVVWVWNDF